MPRLIVNRHFETVNIRPVAVQAMGFSGYARIGETLCAGLLDNVPAVLGACRPKRHTVRKASLEGRWQDNSKRALCAGYQGASRGAAKGGDFL